MGCPAGSRSVFTRADKCPLSALVFTRASRAKRELHCIFLGKRAIIITSKHGTTTFFPITVFFLGNYKNCPESARKRVYRIVLMRPGHPMILIKSSKFNMDAVLVKRSIEATVHLQKR